MYSFPDLEPVYSFCCSNCYFLTCMQISQEAGQVVWYPHFFQNFPQFIVIHIGKRFGVINKAKVDTFLELFCFVDDLVDVGNLISASSAFSKSSLNIWKFTVHILLKTGLKNLEHYFASMWDECSCVVVWTFFGFAFVWDWNENWLSQSCDNGCVFQICWCVECSTFTVPSFRIWNNSSGISIASITPLPTWIIQDNLIY